MKNGAQNGEICRGGAHEHLPSVRCLVSPVQKHVGDRSLRMHAGRAPCPRRMGEIAWVRREHRRGRRASQLNKLQDSAQSNHGLLRTQAVSDSTQRKHVLSSGRLEPGGVISEILACTRPDAPKATGSGECEDEQKKCFQYQAASPLCQSARGRNRIAQKQGSTCCTWVAAGRLDPPRLRLEQTPTGSPGRCPRLIWERFCQNLP